MTHSIERTLPGTDQRSTAAPSEASAPGGRTTAVLNRALAEIRATKAALARYQAPVAVAGVGCRFPSASGPDEFWDLLIGGRCAVSEVPEDRWGQAGHYDPDPATPGRTYTRHGAFLRHHTRFDPGLFGIHPREASTIDPQQRLLLETTWLALEDAGIAPDSLRGTATGVYIAASGSDHERARLATSAIDDIDAHTATGNATALTANRISYLLGLTGPSLVVDTACSSALVALHLATNALRAGQITHAIVGAANLILTPHTTVALSKARMLSPTGRCHTFDASADGYVRGEGVGILVLTRTDPASPGPGPRRADAHSRPRALIRGTAVNQDGRSSGLTVPNGAAQQAVIRSALADAGIEPHAVGYVEAHGTGTPLGDPIELNALHAAYHHARRTEPLAVASVKTNIGHLEAAAGMAGLIKTILSLQHGVIPAHLGLDRPSPSIGWAALDLRVPTSAMAWTGPERVAGVSSFGFGGTNAHAILSTAPGPGQSGPPPVGSRPGEPADTGVTRVKLSAVDADALVWWAADLATALTDAADPALADVAWVMNTARADLPCRVVLAVRSVPDLIERLRDGDALRAAAHLTSPTNRPAIRLHVAATGAPAGLVDLLDRAQRWLDLGLEPVRITGEGIGVAAAAVLAGLADRPGGADDDAQQDAAGRILARLAPADRAELADARPSPAGELRLDLTGSTADAAARAWLAGHRILWPAVTATPATTALRLPGYPLSRTGRELADPPARAGEAAVARPAGPRPADPAGIDAAVVDLSGGGAVARCVIDPDVLLLLPEHVVLDRRVVPGVVLIELLLRAAGEAFRRAGAAAAPAVTDIVIHRPLVADPGRPIEVQAEVSPPVDGRSTARILARTGDRWHLHLEAACLPRTALQHPAAPAGTGTEPGVSRTGAQVYAELWHPSFHLGESFRLVERVTTAGRQGHAVLVAPPDGCAGLRTGIRPELLVLDAAVQLVGMVAGTSGVAWQDRPVHLGTGYRSLELYTDDVAGPVHAEVLVTEDTATQVTGDVMLRGPDGEPLARLGAVTFRPVSAALLDRVRRSGRGESGLPGADRDTLGRLAPAERPAALLAGLRARLAALLGVDPGAVDPDLPLIDLADSLLVVELRTHVQDALEIDVSMETVIDAGTLRTLTGALLAAARLDSSTTTPGQRQRPAPAPGRPGRRTSFGTRIRLMDVPEMDELAGAGLGFLPAAPAPAPAGPGPGAVLLTGASGFVGAFLLDTLLRHTDRTVVCLVRAENEEHARRRLLANLADHRLPAPADPHRVQVVVGALDEPYFGLTASGFQDLHDRVGEIFHNGAMVKWTYPYKGLAPANVDGTAEVIRLATLDDVRPVHLTSTVGVFSSGSDDRASIDETTDLLTSGPLAVGYAQTKWVAERMLRRAGAAGLPFTVHRINSGAARGTGAFNRLDHLSMILKGCIESGTAPTEVAMPLQPAPVDHIAEVMVRLALDPAHRGSTFHHVNPQPLSWTELFDHVADFGFPTRRLGFEQWRTSITDRASGTMALLGLAPFLEDTVDYVRLAEFTCERTTTVARAAGLRACPPLDRDLIHTTLRAFVERGFVPKP
ncbi:thioester reductase domain-containing protein [Actinoplanes sp. N902-109]|uniref:thioester reductase domain-containing protein n=1 Tax=Actinoplanes sp. (strain N902-109) TaxID=649831 RepID=UPI0003293993|nr:thioester reductase domain-containing protein [Actinoplanes sp. N902-109]AGL16391.1 Beta-ketoacyl synthase:Acyl transferase region [Actinoplanes sp. N902-109]